MRHLTGKLAAAAIVLARVTSAASAQSEPSVDDVVATVNGTDITLGHVLAVRAELPPEYSALPPKTLLTVVTGQLIQHTLLQMEAAPTLSRQAEILIDNEVRAIMAGEALRNIPNVSPSEEDIQAAYAARYKSQPAQTEYNASHILLETKEEAESVRSELDGGADFAEMAKQHSIGPSGPSGGELGWFTEGRMVAEFFDATVALEVGEVSPPAKTDFGWHVIKLNETRDREAPALDTVRNEIVTALREQVVTEHLDKLEAAADVKRHDLSDLDPNVINQIELLGN